jgi:hypothetical protein
MLLKAFVSYQLSAKLLHRIPICLPTIYYANEHVHRDEWEDGKIGFREEFLGLVVELEEKLKVKLGLDSGFGL